MTDRPLWRRPRRRRGETGQLRRIDPVRGVDGNTGVFVDTPDPHDPGCGPRIGPSADAKLRICLELHGTASERENPRRTGGFVVGDTGIEPVTSSVSGKRATAAPIAQVENQVLGLEVDTGFEPVYTALQAAASPLGQSTVHGFTTKRTGMNLRSFLIRADDEIRTRDPHLGKVMRYHCATSALPAFLRAERL
jgi:hypothetical protein